jgi:tetratricopeptide (TPR) repeat protein
MPIPALLPLPTLAIAPLYPAGFFPPAGLPEAAALLLGGDAAGAAGAYRAGMGDEPHRGAVGVAVAEGVMGRYEAALAGFEGAAPAPGDLDLAIAQANRSAALLGLGRLGLAERAAADALRAGRRTRDGAVTAVGGLASALAHLARGRRADARARLGEAVRGFAQAGDVLRQVQCHHLLGEIAYDAEDPIRAGSHYRDALALARPAAMDGAVRLLTLRFEHR